MDGVAGEENGAALRVTFDSRLKLEFHGTKVTSDGGLLACFELDDTLGLSETAGEVLTRISQMGARSSSPRARF